MHPRVDGTDLCLSATDESVGDGAQIILAKCPSLPWEFSYVVAEAFRIKIEKLCEYRQIVERWMRLNGPVYCLDVSGPNRTVVLNYCVGKYNDKAKYQDFIWQCPDDVPDW